MVQLSSWRYFRTYEEVEVRLPFKGYKQAWWPAKIVEMHREPGKPILYTVEFFSKDLAKKLREQNLYKEDGLVHMVYSQDSEDLRAKPKQDTTPLSQRFQQILAERKSGNIGKAHAVDLFHLGAWWYGYVYDVYDDGDSNIEGIAVKVFSTGISDDQERIYRLCLDGRHVVPGGHIDKTPKHWKGGPLGFPLFGEFGFLEDVQMLEFPKICNL